MALSPRKKKKEVAKAPLKKVKGPSFMRKVATKISALAKKRFPSKTKKSDPVISKQVKVTPAPSVLLRKRVPVKKGAPVISKQSKVVVSPVAKSMIAAPKIERRIFQEMPRELPDNYGDDQIYLIVRDPYWIYSYWEIQDSYQREQLEKLGGNWENVVSVLRVYDTTDESQKTSFSDVVLQNMVKCWYLNTQPNHSYFVELGLLHKDGRFICLAKSNHVTTPRSGMSEIIDDQWMSIDFDKMYALSGGFQVGKSSAELRTLMEERFKNAITSGSGAGAVSSLSSPVKIKQRGFHFWLECELIIYGGTEPDAKVTMQGRPVQLRPDGTFTLRYGLPDGKFIFDCHAESSDGIEERVITPVIGRNTERPAPVLKTGKLS